MSETRRILEEAEQGQAQAAAQLLPLVYDELRRLAAQKLLHESPGQTLQATALVHEVYLRLAGSGAEPEWKGRSHFLGVAAEAMRRILINRARDKKRLKRGGDRRRLALDEWACAAETPDEDLLALNEALEGLAAEEPRCAELVKLRFFVGLTLEEAALALGLSRRTTDRDWAYARAWLYDQLERP